jgi:hypothetical protein
LSRARDVAFMAGRGAAVGVVEVVVFIGSCE